MLLNIFTTAIFLFFACVILLSEEKIRHHNCRNSPCKVGEQCVTRSIARLHHAHTAEIDCEDIERGVGGVLTAAATRLTNALRHHSLS